MYYIVLRCGNEQRVYAYSNRSYANSKYEHLCEMYAGTPIEVKRYYSDGKVRATILNDFDNFIKYTY